MRDADLEAKDLKYRLSKAKSAITAPQEGLYMSKDYNEAMAELEDIVLDFKTLSHVTDKEAPINEEVKSLPISYYKQKEYYLPEDYIKRLEYLINKFIDYNTPE